LQFL